jgi:hypothetical protein
MFGDMPWSVFREKADLKSLDQQSEAAVESKTTRDGHAHHGLTL